MKFPEFRVNRDLLRLKAQYFLQYAGLAPISPYIPTIAKDLGFTTVSIGWIYTVGPIVMFFAKPALGSLADKYRKEKLVFMGCLAMTAVSLFSLQWLPSLLPSPSSAHLDCTHQHLTLCSDSRPLGYPNNTFCKVSMKQENRRNASNDSLDLYNLSLNKSSTPFSSVDFYFKEGFDSKENCLHLEPMRAADLEILCGQEPAAPHHLPVEVDCGLSPGLSDDVILISYQFWLLLLIVLTMRVAQGTASTLGDAICLSKLGDKARNFGRQRMWAGIGWGLMSFTSSMIVDAYSKGKPLKDYTISYYITIGFITVNLISILGIKVTPNTKSKSLLNEVSAVIKDPKICLFLGWCFLNGLYLSSISNFLFWFLEDLDASQGNTNIEWMKTLEGLTTMLQTFGGEVPMFFIAGWILKKLGHVNVMTLVLFGFTLRFFLYAILSDPWLVLPIESLHGVCYGLSFATMTTHAKTIARPGTECTVQSLVSVVMDGAGSSTGSLLMGYMVKALGYTTSYIILSASAGIFAVVHLLIVNISKLSSRPDDLKSKQGLDVEEAIETVQK